MNLLSALQACVDWMPRALGLPRPDPESRANLALLDSCELWDQAGSLRLALAALLALGASKEDVERATAAAEFGRLSEKVKAASPPASSLRL